MSEKHDQPRPRLNQRVPSGPRPNPFTSRQRTSSSNALVSAWTSGQNDQDASFRVLQGDKGLASSPKSSSPEVSEADLDDPFKKVITPSPGIRKQVSLPTLSHVTPLSSPVKSAHHAKSPTSTSVLSPRFKPKPLRLDTSDLLPPPSSSPKKAISPSLRHWQQVRSHVLTTPAEEKAPAEAKGSKGIVGKAAARLGFKAVVDNVLGHDDRRKFLSMDSAGVGGLSGAEKEEITRERRKFARDVKTCLDQCAQEESTRRLNASRGSGPALNRPGGATIPLSPPQAEFSAFAPLLTELHRYLPAARARKPWSRTCPHHATILAELSTAFLPSSYTSPGERQQALEVFGVIVRTWSADNAEEELARWVWLCRALKVGDRQLRNRGLTLLSSFWHRDPSLPSPPEYPSSALSFRSLAMALLELLHAVDQSSYEIADHRQKVMELLNDLSEGSVIHLYVDSLRLLMRMPEVEMSGGVEKDLLWMALAHSAISPRFSEWLFSPDNPTILRFTPPPILHATPPLILHLRAKSAATFLSSLAAAVPYLPPLTIRQIYDTIYDLIIRDIQHLPDTGVELPACLGQFIAASYVYGSRVRVSGGFDAEDPFLEVGQGAEGATWHVIAMERTISLGEDWAEGLSKGLQALIRDISLTTCLAAVESVLAWKSVKAFVTPCMDSFFERITHSPKECINARAFLLRLRSAHPQLFYKSLFSLAACSQSTKTLEHLKTVQALTDAVGRNIFWLKADPEMLAVVLMGTASSGQGKHMEPAPELEVTEIRIGRYAVLVELLVTLDGVNITEKADTRDKIFIGAVEARLGMMLARQEGISELPGTYRSLICVLFFRLRSISKSARKATWQRSVLRWYLSMDNDRSSSTTSESLSHLSELHRSLRNPDSAHSGTAVNKRKSTMTSDPSSRLPSIEAEDPIYRYLHPQLLTSLAEIMVLSQACWTLDDWGDILLVSWTLLGTPNTPTLLLLFLLNKCAEMVPVPLRAVLEADLRHSSPVVRSTAMRNIATAYAYRHQILSLGSIATRKGSMFHFTPPTLDFVFTEIGSAQWSAPQETEQEAMQKYGGSLHVETRQRLMELGWSDNRNLRVNRSNPAEPISSLPIRYLLDADQGKKQGRSGIKRSSSTGSGSDDGTGSKPRKAIFAPIFWEVVVHQAIQALASEGDTAFILLELTRMLQRDEPNSFIGPLAAHFSVDFPGALSLLNALTIRTTPAFAYFAMNAVVGYLKHSIRYNLDSAAHARALSTIANLIPNVSGVSLRDVRKNKAEHVLLPASIQEEQGGFKVHAPWRNNQVDIQAAQLLILTAIIQVNPGDVHIVKRMMSNLQVHTSLGDLTFSRAWLKLVITLLTTINRNYNDRAELRHFLTITTVILQTHRSDLLVISSCIRFFMLCSARFRRMFAGMGFQTVVPALLSTYSTDNGAIRDGIEYAMRSFYRIHQDSFVYQTCLAIAASQYDPEAAYNMLACLSTANTATCGTSSGLRGLNDKEEWDALIQMSSGPEIALSEIGKDRAERQAAKLVGAAFDSRLFPKENIVRLFITVIAANPPSSNGINMMKLLIGIVPFMKDDHSMQLLGDGVEALAGIMSREKIDQAASTAMSRDDGAGDPSDWRAAKAGYIRVVEAWTITGGPISAICTQTVFDMVEGLVKAAHEEVYPIAADIFRSLTRTNLTSARPDVYLKSTAPLFASACSVFNVSGVIREITAWLQRKDQQIDPIAANIIVEKYLRVAMRHVLRSPPVDRFDKGELHPSVVALLTACTDLPVDVLAVIEQEPVSVDILWHILFPFVRSVSTAHTPTPAHIKFGMWIRILNYVIKSIAPDEGDVRAIALQHALSTQVIKVIILRAPDAISSVDGLWPYLATYLTGILGKTTDSKENIGSEVTLRDYIAWSIYEVLALHRSPMMIYFKSRITTELMALGRPSQAEVRGSISSAPSPSPRSHRETLMPSSISAGRLPSISLRRPSGTLDVLYPISRRPDDSSAFKTSPRPTPSSDPRDFLSRESLGSSVSSPVRRHTSVRPTFTDLSLQRASYALPVHSMGRETAPGVYRRFPSSATVKRVDIAQEGGAKGGAIVHLLGTSNKVMTAPSGFTASNSASSPGLPSSALLHVIITAPVMLARIERGQRACRLVFGDSIALEEDEEPIKEWSIPEALNQVSKDTRMMVQEAFSGVSGCCKEANGERDDVSGMSQHEEADDPHNKHRDRSSSIS